MGKRGVVTDYAGNPIHAGDLVTYAARQGNRVRSADAIVQEATAKLVDGRLRPMLLVLPTGVESGFVKRDSFRREWISTEHARVVIPNYTGEREE